MIETGSTAYPAEEIAVGEWFAETAGTNIISVANAARKGKKRNESHRHSVLAALTVEDPWSEVRVTNVVLFADILGQLATVVSCLPTR